MGLQNPIPVEAEDKPQGVVLPFSSQQNKHWISLFFLLTLGAGILLIRLDYPNAVVFDEFHHGKHINSYIKTGQRYFDVHPPLVKLVMAWGAVMGGYEGGETFKRIGTKYEKTSVSFRWLPAVASCFFPLVFFGLIRLLGGSFLAGLVAVFALCFENGRISHSRFLQPDSLIWLFGFASLTATLWFEKQRSRKIRWLGILLSGTLLGFSIGGKFTSLAFVPMIAAVVLGKPLRFRDRKELSHRAAEVLAVFLIAGSWYVGSWKVHWDLLPAQGHQDKFYKMKNNFFENFTVAHRQMWDRNKNLNAKHRDASYAFVWPLMRNAVYYYNTKGPRRIYLLGNPVVWLGFSGFAFAIVMIWFFSLSSKLKIPRAPEQRFPWLAPLGIIATYCPFLLVTRTMFVYHYFPALFFAILTSVLWLDRIQWFKKHLRWKMGALFAAILFGFLAVAPWTFAWNYEKTHLEWVLRFFHS